METQMLFVVDRREGDFFVLVDDNGTALDVRRDDLPSKCQHEGAVIRVPVDDRGNHAWKSAVRDEAEEKSRKKEAEERLRRLKQSDTGGDIAL